VDFILLKCGGATFMWPIVFWRRSLGKGESVKEIDAQDPFPDASSGQNLVAIEPSG